MVDFAIFGAFYLVFTIKVLYYNKACLSTDEPIKSKIKIYEGKNEKMLKKIQSNPNYRWVIVSVSCLMVLTVLGFCSSSKSIYVSPVCEALGISRSAFSVNDSCRYIATSVVNIFFGMLIAKFGAKKLILAGFASLITSMLIYSQSTNVFGFYIGGIFLGIGLSWTTTTMVGAVVNKWCAKNKGTIMGIVLASNGVGAALAIQLLTPIIYDSTNPFGYRTSYKLVALILLVIAGIIMLLFKNEPGEKPEFEKDAGVEKKIVSDTAVQHPNPLRKSYFYIAAVCIFFTGMILQGVTGIAAPMLGDVGLHSSYVATVLSVHSLVLTLSKFSTGFMCDRVGVKKTSLTCFFAALLAMALLLCSGPTSAGKIAAMIYGILSPFALPLETIMLPIYAGEFSEKSHFNKILGIFVSVNTAGYAVGAPVANLCYDITGSYNILLYMSCIIILLISFTMQFAINKAQKDRKATEQMSELFLER